MTRIEPLPRQSHTAPTYQPRPAAIVTRIVAALAALATPPAALAQSTLSQADLIRRSIALDRLTQPAGPERLLRAGGEKDGVVSLEGPGCVSRIFAAGDEGQIRITVDGQVVVETTLGAFFGGAKPPFVPPLTIRQSDGSAGSARLPIGFAKSCEVRFSGCRGAFAVEHLALPADVRVQPFGGSLDDDARAAVEELDEVLRNGFTPKQLFGDRRRLPIAVEANFKGARDERVIREQVEGSGTIRALYVALTDRANPRTLYALHGCILRLYWDGQKTPAVEAPLVDFFGSGFELTGYGGVAMGTDRLLELPLPDRRVGESTFLYSYFPMPFSNGATIEIENVGGARLGLLLYVEVERTPPDIGATRFYAAYRRVHPTTAETRELLRINGAGRLVGLVLNVDQDKRGWRTDDLLGLATDGATGSESTSSVAAFFGVGSVPTGGSALGAGATRFDPFGKCSVYRWLIDDAISFQKSMSISLTPQSEPGRAVGRYVGVLAYWYAAAGSRSNAPPLGKKEWAPPGLYMPGAVEIENRVRGEGWGAEVKQKHAGLVEFSGEAAVRITTAEPVRIALIHEKGGAARLKLRVHPRRRFETITVATADGATIGVLTYGQSEGKAGVYDLGDVTLKPGENELVVTCSKPAVLDCWIVEPK